MEYFFLNIDNDFIDKNINLYEGIMVALVIITIICVIGFIIGLVNSIK